jgi:hypothetical protein
MQAAEETVGNGWENSPSIAFPLLKQGVNESGECSKIDMRRVGGGVLKIKVEISWFDLV